MGEEGGKESIRDTYRYTVTTRMTPAMSIKMSSDESRFNVSLTVRDKVPKTVSTDHNFFEHLGPPRWLLLARIASQR